LLKRLKAKYLFFEPHQPDEPQMRSAYMNLDNLEFVQFVAATTGLTVWNCIGHGEEGRPLYMLTAK
ncbi:MAG TPA: hypothetical protein VGK87_16485, partial [Anaerolineae bacterium]